VAVKLFCSWEKYLINFEFPERHVSPIPIMEQKGDPNGGRDRKKD
jgi:hypothetical protein